MKLSYSYYFYKTYFRWLPFIKNQHLYWKDKFNSPRVEISPSITIEWLWFGYRGQWGSYQYWEQWLWIHKYCGGNIETAKKEWGWVDVKTQQSTWIDF